MLLFISKHEVISLSCCTPTLRFPFVNCCRHKNNKRTNSIDHSTICIKSCFLNLDTEFRKKNFFYN